MSLRPLEKERYRPDEHAIVRRVQVASPEDLIAQKYQTTIRHFKVKKICLLCEQEFCILDNIIARQCAIHIGRIIDINGYQSYSCCGRDTSHLGCISIMHISNPGILKDIYRNNFDRKVAIPKQMIDSNIIPHSKEILEDWPYGSLSQTNANSSIVYYHISMVAIFAPIRR